MRKSRLSFGLAFVSLVTIFSFANSANAQVVVYNTIHAVTPGITSGDGMYPPSFDPTFFYTYLATSFVPSGSYLLTRIDVFATFNVDDTMADPKGTNSGVVVELLSDAGGRPGTVLESWTIPPLLPPFGYGSPQLLTPTSPIPLSDGTRYWLAMSPIGPNGIADWMTTPPSPGTTLGSHDGTTWHSDSDLSGQVPAFDVWGEPTGATPIRFPFKPFELEGFRASTAGPWILRGTPIGGEGATFEHPVGPVLNSVFATIPAPTGNEIPKSGCFVDYNQYLITSSDGKSTLSLNSYGTRCEPVGVMAHYDTGNVWLAGGTGEFAPGLQNAPCWLTGTITVGENPDGSAVLKINGFLVYMNNMPKD